jgi:hypothetical protein
MISSFYAWLQRPNFRRGAPVPREFHCTLPCRRKTCMVERPPNRCTQEPARGLGPCEGRSHAAHGFRPSSSALSARRTSRFGCSPSSSRMLTGVAPRDAIASGPGGSDRPQLRCDMCNVADHRPRPLASHVHMNTWHCSTQ